MSPFRKERKHSMKRSATILTVTAGLLLPAALSAAPPDNARTIRLVQDDAQQFMVSKVYKLQ